MIVNLANPKNSKTYTVKLENTVYLGRKLKDKVDLSVINVKGKGVITGGSTKEGFPMVPFLDQPSNKKVLLSDGIGFRAKHNGEKRRKTVHGAIVSNKIAQLNIKITELDKSENLDEKFGKKKEEKKE